MAAVESAIKDLRRVLDLLSRTARARHQQATNQTLISRMSAELLTAVSGMLDRHGDTAVEIRPEGFFYDDELALQEPNTGESLAHLFHRDGLRRIELMRGLTANELDTIIGAAVEGMRFSGFGDDAVSELWRHDFAHFRFSSVDPMTPSAEMQLEREIQQTFGAMYGQGQPEVAIQALADSLDRLDETAPGCHPQRSMRGAPAYGAALAVEAAQDDEKAIAVRTIDAAIDAAQEIFAEREAAMLLDAFVPMLDRALEGHDLITVSRLVMAASKSRAPAEHVSSFLGEALSETRRRAMIAAYKSNSTPETTEAMVLLFRVVGKETIPLAFDFLKTTTNDETRRMLADLILELGIERLDKIRELLNGDNEDAIRAGLYILFQLGTTESQDTLSKLETGGRNEVRVALAEVAGQFQSPLAFQTAKRLLEDRNPAVRVAAVRVLSKSEDDQAAKTLETIANNLESTEEPFEVKQAFLECYATVHHVRALPLLQKYVKKAEGLLTKKPEEDLAVAAVEAMPHVAIPRTVDALKKICALRNKRVAQAARDALMRMKERTA